jgi:transcriptional regulator GlxA family with amidase domain
MKRILQGRSERPEIAPEEALRGSDDVRSALSSGRVRIEIPVFDGVDEIDVFGPFEVLAGSGFEVELVGVEAPGRIATQRGVRLETVVALGRPDALIVPGGGWLSRAPEGAYVQARRGILPAKLAELASGLDFIASVCTGSMLLARAGLLERRHATTNRSAQDELRELGVHVVDERVVDDGTVITAGGLTAGIDLGLHIVERELGTEAADLRARSIEYVRQGRVWRAPPPAAPG